jgi:hypothetical protein
MTKLTVVLLLALAYSAHATPMVWYSGGDLAEWITSYNPAPTMVSWSAMDQANHQMVGAVTFPLPGGLSTYLVNRGDPRVDFDALIVHYSELQATMTLDVPLIYPVATRGFAKFPYYIKNPVVNQLEFDTVMAKPNGGEIFGYAYLVMNGTATVDYSTPEPSSLVLAVVGIAGLALRRR